MYQDKTLKCRDCGQDFVFTASEQAFFAEKGFQNDPVAAPLAALLAATRTVATMAPVRCTK